MIKANITAGTYTANATLPLSLAFNTNNSFRLNSNTLEIRKAGFIELEGTLTLIGTAVGDVQIQLQDENGNVLTSSTASFTAIGDYATVPLYDMLRTIYNTLGTYGKISLVTNSAVTVNNGIISGKYIN